MWADVILDHTDLENQIKNSYTYRGDDENDLPIFEDAPVRKFLVEISKSKMIFECFIS